MAAASSKQLLLPGQPVPLPPRQPQPASGPGTYVRSNRLLSSLVGYAQTASPSSSSSQSSATLSVLSWRSGASQQPSPSSSATASASASHLISPQPGSTILGRVTRVTPRQATVSILIIDGRPVGYIPVSISPSSLSGGAEVEGSIGGGQGNSAAGEDAMGNDFTGIIRSQDVRRTDKDRVRLAECFRPGDIVKAEVISLGDARSYYLSTASNHLGVIYALSSSTSSTPSHQSDTSPSSSQGGVNMSDILSDDPQTSSTRRTRLEPVSWNEMRDPNDGSIEKRKVAKPEGI